MFDWEWYSVIVAISSIVAFSMLRNTPIVEKIAGKSLLYLFGVAAIGYTASALGSIFNPISKYTSIIADLSWITIASLLLTSLANFLRDDKPVYARYPITFTFLPFLILPVYPFILDTIVIKEWVLALYQSGSLVITFLLIGLLVTRDSKYAILFAALILFSILWVLRWIIEPVWFSETYRSLFVAAGMILFSKTFKDVTHHQ
jgi:hypothetical protein